MGSLLGFAAVVLFVGASLTPYDPEEQYRDDALRPPTRIRFVDRDGRLHPWPFVYAPAAEGVAVEGGGRRYPLRFMTRRQRPEAGVRERIPGARLVGVDPPARLFLFGTDELGRDLFSRLLVGARASLAIALGAAACATGVGLVAGALAGFFAGWLDAMVSRLADLAFAIPWVYLLLALRAALPLELSAFWAPLLIVAVVAAAGWARPARLVRAAIRQTATSEFVLAARAAGISEARILFRHVLPAARPLAATQMALLVPQCLFAEIALSFLGLGLPEPAASWGGLLAASQRYSVLVSSWWLLIPLCALVPVVGVLQWLAGALSVGAPRSWRPGAQRRRAGRSRREER